MSVVVENRIHSQGPAVQNLRLKAVEVPTVIVLSGLLGSGKTSLAESIFQFNETPPEARAMLFNERNLSLAQTDAARIPDSIRKTTLDGCACCSSNTKLLEAVTQFLDDNKKLVLIEQSGVTDGGQLRATLEDALGKRARVRLIAIVDSEHLDAPPSVLHSSILASDCVLASHATSEASLKKASRFLKELNGKNFDFIQGRAGDFSEDVWNSLNQRKASPAGLAGGLSVVTSGVPKDSAEYKKERAKLLRSTQSVGIVLYPEVDINQIALSLSQSTVLIDRAKGYMQSGGKWSSIQYELKDDSHAAICVNQVPDAPTLMSGRPHLFILSTHGSPPAECFLKIGTPDFSEKAVEYYINLYPSKDEMERMLVQGAGIPVRSDGDVLFMAAHRLLEHIEEIPESRIEEFEGGFITLLDKYVSWRLEALDLLSKEHRVDQTFDTAERQVTLGYNLSWILNRFGGLIQNGEVFGNLFDRLLGSKPASMLYEGLSKMRQFEIDGEEEVTLAKVNDIALFAAQGKQLEGLLPENTEKALKNLRALASTGKNESLASLISKLEKDVRDQFQ